MAQNNFKKQKEELQKTIAGEKRKILVEKEMVSARIDEIDRKLKEIPDMEKELAMLNSELASLESAEKEKISRDQLSKELKGKVNVIKGVNRDIKVRGQQVSSKIQMLDTPPEDVCPVCDRGLTYSHRVSIKDKLRSRRDQERILYKKNLEQLAEIQKQIDFLEKEGKQAKRKLMGKSVVTDRIEEIKKKIGTIKNEAKELSGLEYQKRDLINALRARDYAPMAQEMLKKVGVNKK